MVKKNIRDKESSRRWPGIVTEEIVQKIEKLIQEDHSLMVNELHKMCPEVIRNVPHEKITDHLSFRKQTYACWCQKC